MFLIFKHVLSSVKLYPASCISPSTEDRAKRSSSLIITETQFTTMESNETTHVSHQNGRIWKHWYYQLLVELSEVKDSYVCVDITLRSHSGDQTGRICEIKNLFALRHSKLPPEYIFQRYSQKSHQGDRWKRFPWPFMWQWELVFAPGSYSQNHYNSRGWIVEYTGSPF